MKLKLQDILSPERYPSYGYRSYIYIYIFVLLYPQNIADSDVSDVHLKLVLPFSRGDYLRPTPL